jgi:hypothetical protein
MLRQMRRWASAMLFAGCSFWTSRKSFIFPIAAAHASTFSGESSTDWKSREALPDNLLNLSGVVVCGSCWTSIFAQDASKHMLSNIAVSIIFFMSAPEKISRTRTVLHHKN